MGNKLKTNFTPIIDEVAADVGIVGATVFGVVWRYCQMDGECCEASYQTIADRAYVDRRTAIRHIKLLCDRGYLVDRGAAKQTHPHRYELTSKAQMMLMASGSGDTELVTESHQSVVTESHQLDETSDRKSPELVTESHSTSDRESPKETLQESLEETEDIIPEHPARWGAFAEVLYGAKTAKAQARLAVAHRTQCGNLAKDFPDATPDEIRQFYPWWRKHDWRGEKGQRPTPNQLRERWADYWSAYQKYLRVQEVLAEDAQSDEQSVIVGPNTPPRPDLAMRDLLGVPTHV